MRYLLLSLPLLPTLGLAQCAFDPTVQPTDLILCPNEQAELTTQEYDSYQWYKAGEPIEGQTGQSLFVDQFNDAGYEFSVEVTMDGCTEMSPTVLVDGWAFLPIYVIHGGDEPNGIIGEGGLQFCAGDTLTLTMGITNPQHVTWYRNFLVLEGEEGQELVITTTGNYTCSAAPEVCPNYIMHLGVSVAAYFDEPQQPTITPNDSGALCASPEGESYQWYYQGQPLAGTDMACIVPSSEGAYTVYVDYGSDCQVISEPFLVTGLHEHTSSAARLVPNPAQDQLSVLVAGMPLPAAGWSIIDASGRVVLRGVFNGNANIDIGNLSSGLHTLRIEGLRPIPFAKH